ncbi:TPA_asm: hp [Altiarchaeum virus]|nr:TPA_asm: hp [Altiarchaeum virus]
MTQIYVEDELHLREISKRTGISKVKILNVLVTALKNDFKIENLTLVKNDK